MILLKTTLLFWMRNHELPGFFSLLASILTKDSQVSQGLCLRRSSFRNWHTNLTRAPYHLCFAQNHTHSTQTKPTLTKTTMPCGFSKLINFFAQGFYCLGSKSSLFRRLRLSSSNANAQSPQCCRQRMASFGLGGGVKRISDLGRSLNRGQRSPILSVGP